MLPAGRLGRSALSLLLVAACSWTTAFAARRMIKPLPYNAPAYRVKGSPSARVEIVAYSDFQCPACRAAAKPMGEIMALYGKDVRLLFKHMPLERLHPHARAAAAVAECAGRQSRFWEMHDLLFEKQPDWAESQKFDALMAGYAKQLGLDGAAFAACLKDPATAAAIDSDARDSDLRWVRSTPTFFINRRRFVGPRQLSASAPIWIEKQLK